MRVEGGRGGGRGGKFSMEILAGEGSVWLVVRVDIPIGCCIFQIELGGV
jgi:hypothetical protein